MPASVFQDLRFALRTFLRSPGFTCATLLTLALGIGGNTAIFSVIDAALLHPIPFPAPDRLVSLYQKTGRDDRNSISYPNLLDWQQRTRTLEAIAGVRRDTFTLTGHGDPEPLIGLTVSSNLLSILRIQPVLGRMFTPQEDQKGGAPVALLGEAFWKRRFAGDPKILGQTLRLNGRDMTVIGIMPARVRLFHDTGTFFNDVFTPIGQNETPIFYDRGTADGTLALGRLKPGVTLGQARAEMETIMRNLAAQYPGKDADVGVNVVSYREDIAGKIEPVLLALGAAVGLVLLIACTNVANLMLARSASRSQEFGIRVALGAGRGRLIRQLLTESVLLSLAGGALGLLLASWFTGATLSVLPSVLPALSEVQINSRVLWFTFALSLLTGVLFGLAPAFKTGGAKLNETLRQGGRGVLRGRRRPQYVLIVAEVALTMMLLASAGLVMRSLHNLWNVNPGFNPQNILVVHTGLPEQSSSAEKTIGAFRELNDRLNAIPGVEVASVDLGGLPFMGDTGIGFRRADAVRDAREMKVANAYWVTGDHLKAMGIPLVRGRFFSDRDTEKSPLVTVIDEESAGRLFPGQDPIGRSVVTGASNNSPVRIVGIAGRVKHSALDPDATANGHAQLYFPISQTPGFLLPLAANNGVTAIVRSNIEPLALLNILRKQLKEFTGDRAIFGDQRMTDAITGSLAPRRFSLILLGAFAAVALILSVIGIYGVVSYVISQRTNEIGVRMTLGARPSDIFLGVLWEGAIMGAVGIAIGIAGAAAVTHLLANLLFGVSPTDFPTFLGAAALLLGCTILACYVPARRAVRVDPAAALRCG